MNNTQFEDLQKDKTTCLGCGNNKSLGLVVCWNCFKYRSDITPLKYYNGSFQEWLDTIPHISI